MHTMTEVVGIERHRCNAVGSFVELVSSIRARWTRAYETLFDPWFRGQRVAQWPLRPSLYRYALGNDEADLRLEFRRRGLQLIPGHVPADDWQWRYNTVFVYHNGAESYYAARGFRGSLRV